MFFIKIMFQENSFIIPITVIGYDYRRASTRIREQLITSETEKSKLLSSIPSSGEDYEKGLIVLETCNRVEWIVHSENIYWIGELFKANMVNRLESMFSKEECIPSPYVYYGMDAVMHILRVIAGLESLALGEAQIARQCQRALKQAQKNSRSTPLLNRLGTIGGRVAKSAEKLGFRSNTFQGLHTLVARFLFSYFNQSLDDKCIGVIGMGEIGRKTANILEEVFNAKVIRINRTIQKKHHSSYKPFDALKDYSSCFDAIVVATGGPNPIINQKICPIKSPKYQKKILIMDIGIPKQVADCIIKQSNVLYKNIDDLLKLETADPIKQYIPQVEAEIIKEAHQFKKHCLERHFVQLLENNQNKRREYILNRIPNYVKNELTDISEPQRKKIEEAMKDLITEYSNYIFSSIHTTLEEKWGD